jgi:hypothetical protein
MKDMLMGGIAQERPPLPPSAQLRGHTGEFIPIKPLAAMGSDAPESYAVHSRVP